jgi:hypothetical protein
VRREQRLGAITLIGLAALSCALLLKHVFSVSPLSEFLMGAGSSLLLLGLVTDRIGPEKLRALKKG